MKCSSFIKMDLSPPAVTDHREEKKQRLSRNNRYISVTHKVTMKTQVIILKHNTKRGRHKIINLPLNYMTAGYDHQLSVFDLKVPYSFYTLIPLINC